MNRQSALTKNCIAPWQMFEITLAGGIRPCSGPIEGDFGTISTCLSDPSGIREVFASEAHKRLKVQLLTGKLPDACVNCRCAPEENIPTESLKCRVEFYLRSCGITISDTTDLTSEFTFEICTTGLTDKCNLSCIYCFTHSNDRTGEGMRGYCEANHHQFLQMMETFAENGLKRLHLCGGGELTTYPAWKELCTELFDRYPSLNIGLVSNFAKKFTDAELDLLMRFSEITISCDTIDPELFSWLRRGGRIDVLLDNIKRLKSRFTTSCGRNPVLILNITESNVILDKLVDVARYASDNCLGLQFSNLIIVKGSYADENTCLTKIADIPDNQVLPAWEIISDLPERMTAQNRNSYLFFGPLYEIMKQRAEAMTLNRFVPAADELFYSSFAASHPKNPDAFLRKIFQSYDDSCKGILIRSGTTLDIELPFAAGRLAYRLVWTKSQHNDCSIGPLQEVTVGQHLTIASEKTGDFYTHMLFEVLSYEKDKATVEKLELTEPQHISAAHNPDCLAAQTQYDLGTLYMQQQDIKRARRHLERAIQLQPENIRYKKNLADLLVTALEFEEALTIYLELLAKTPLDTEILKGIAFVCRQVGRTTEARYFLELVLTIQPCDPEVMEILRTYGGERE